MNENDILRKKYEATRYDKISEFMRSVKSELALETLSAVLGKRNKRPSVETLLIMSAELNVTPAELKEMLIARGEKAIARWIAPAALTTEEQKIIEKFRHISDDARKVKLILDTLDNLRR